MNQLVLTIVIDASNLVTSWLLAPKAKLRNCNTIYQRQCSKKFKLHRCLRLGLFLMNQNFVFFSTSKSFFSFSCMHSFQSLGLSGVPSNKTKYGGIGGEIIHLVPQSHGYWLRKKKRKKKRWRCYSLGSFWLNLRLGSFFFASSSSCTFLFFPVASLLSCSFSWCIFGCLRLSFWGYG